MWYFIIKVLLSSVIIGLISEISKRSSLWGSIMASVPLTSVLAIIWIYQETKDTKALIDLSYNIFWLVLPSLAFFIAFPSFLKSEMNFYLSLFLSLILMVLLYFGMVYILGKFGYKI